MTHNLDAAPTGEPNSLAASLARANPLRNGSLEAKYREAKSRGAYYLRLDRSMGLSRTAYVRGVPGGVPILGNQKNLSDSARTRYLAD